MCCFERYRRSLATMAIGGLVLASGFVQALDAGRYGTVYAIREPDLLEEIKRTVQAKVDSGDWARLQADAQKRATDQLTTPRPVDGVSVTTARRSWLHDPSIVLADDVRDSGGRVVIAAGTRVNPLEVVALPQPLLFFDGRDARQVSAAQRVIKKQGGLVTPILVAGSWQHLGKAWQRQVYFDQQGRMVHQLGIQAVPALVTQEAVALRVEEFVP